MEVCIILHPRSCQIRLSQAALSVTVIAVKSRQSVAWLVQLRHEFVAAVGAEVHKTRSAIQLRVSVKSC